MADAKVVIYGLAVKSADRTFQQFALAELQHWTLTNLSPPKYEDGGLAFQDLNDDPVLWTPLAIQLPGSALETMAGALLQTSDGPFLLVMTAFLLILLARMTSRSGRVQAILIAAASCAAYPVVALVMKLNLQSPPVTTVVGFAGYTGYAKSKESLASVLALLICVLLGWVFAKFAGREADEPEEESTASRRRAVLIAHAAVLGLLLLYVLPNMRDILSSLNQTWQRRASWDSTNFLMWDYLIHAGLRPFRDFWYPYGGGYLQLLPFPTGTVAMTFHCTLVLWVLYWSLLKIAGQRLAHGLAIFGLILVPVLLGLLPGWSRYLVAVDVALFYVVVCNNRRFDWKMQVPFAAFAGYAFFFEPTQVVCAVAGMAAETVLAALAGFQGGALRERAAASAQVLKQRFASVGIPLLTGIAGALLFYAGNGMLPGLWDFEASIGAQGDYGALPSEIVLKK